MSGLAASNAALISSTFSSGSEVYTVIVVASAEATSEVPSEGSPQATNNAEEAPTASAVVSDIVDEVKHLNRNIMTMWDQDKVELLPISDTSKRFFVRIKGDPQAMKAHLESKFGLIEIVQVESLEGEFGFLTEIMTEGHFEQCQKEFPSILHRIRVEG